MVDYYMHKIENNSLWKEEMSYGGDILGVWVEYLKSYKKLLLHLANFHLHN